MNIIEIEEFEIMTTKHTSKPGLLVNVHVRETPTENEMVLFAEDIINQKNSNRIIAVSVVFWLQEPKKVRLHSIEHWNQK
jgi:hypothetical protein